MRRAVREGGQREKTVNKTQSKKEEEHRRRRGNGLTVNDRPSRETDSRKTD